MRNSVTRFGRFKRSWGQLFFLRKVARMFVDFMRYFEHNTF